VREGNTGCLVSQPAWPSTSPSVTSVGGTQLNDAQNAEITSSSATGSRITTGGGVSFYYPTPGYQAYYVKKYLSSLPPNQIPPTNTWNSAGRFYPDISAMATNYQIVLSGETIHIGGTSASTPVIAGMIALFNDRRLNLGKRPLGFLNYFLYTLEAIPGSTVFNDITQGNNSCSALPQYCCNYGWFAAPGFDAVTGLGSPVFNQIYKFV
jgi:tripeptidyl-peptidase-1